MFFISRQVVEEPPLEVRSGDFWIPMSIAKYGNKIQVDPKMAELKTA